MRAKAVVIAVVCMLALAGCVDPVRVLAGSPSAERRRAAAKKLGDDRDPASTPHLVAALEDPDERVRAKVAWALGRIASPQALEALSRALGDPSGPVRSEAALGLRHGGAVIAGRLVKALADPEAIVRISAARALGEVRGTVASLGLRQAVVDSDPLVRAAAVEALAAGEAGAVDIQAALSDDNQDVRLAAARAIERRPDVSAVATLTRALDDEYGEVARFAARALVRMPTERAVPGLERVAGTFEGELRESAFRGLGRTRGEGARSALVGFLEHWNPNVRSLAARALGSGLFADSQEALLGALADYDEDVRREAAYSLAVYGRDEGVPLLIEDLRAGPRRAKAIDALAGIGTREATEDTPRRATEVTEDTEGNVPVVSDSSVPSVAASVAGRSSTAAALRRLLADPRTGPEAATAAMIVLAEVASRENVEDIAEAIAPALDSPRPEMRAVAAMAIARSVGSAGRPDDAGRIGALATLRSSSLRSTSSGGTDFGELAPGSRAAGALDGVRALAVDKDPRVRMAAEYAAALLGEETRLEELGLALREGSEPTRWMAAELLTELAGTRIAAAGLASKRLASGLEAPQGAVRMLSARGLARKGLADESIIAALASRAADLEARVRVEAAAALGRIGTPDSVKALGPFVRDREPGVRLAAYLALAEARLAPEEASLSGALALAAGALVDPAPAVRRAALAALSVLSGERFGLKPDRVPLAGLTDDELESAIRRAQIWWNEHERE